MVQAYADSIIGQSSFNNMGPLQPILNVSFFIILIIMLMIVAFNKKELSTRGGMNYMCHRAVDMQ